MLSLEVRTNKNPKAVRERIVSYFGPEGLGLEDTSEGDMLRFTGGGGHVIATLREDSQETVIDFETREFEQQVRSFAAKI